jgi:hypothetical protein
MKRELILKQVSLFFTINICSMLCTRVGTGSVLKLCDFATPIFTLLLIYLIFRRASQQQCVVYHHETMSTTSGSESLRSRRSHLSRSKSLDQEGVAGRYRSRSLDPYQGTVGYN